jgi:uncharacterized membrane protein
MKSTKCKKRRTQAVAKIVEAMPTITPAQLIRAPRVTRMDTMVQCRKVLRAILRAMAKGEIPSQLGARLAYVANLIAALVKQESELKELTQLRDQLAALQGRIPVALPSHSDGDFTPAAVQPTEDQSS